VRRRRRAVGGDGAAGADVLDALLDPAEHVEPVDEFIEWRIVGEPLDGVRESGLGACCAATSTAPG
jgi:hypothetical protein